MKEKTYNHYVPQFLMRNFSSNGKSIGMYIKTSKHYVENASIKEICGKKYLYGKTDELENLLCDIESRWAKIINYTCSSEKIPSDLYNKKLLYAFFTISESRTLYMAEKVKEDFCNILKNDIKYAHHLNLKQYETIEENDIKASISVPNLYLLKSAAELVDDIYARLNLVLIANRTNTPFILSDCPVVKYNFNLLETFFGYGWKQEGILAFAPISPHYMLMLVDKKTYKLKSILPNKIVIKNDTDIFELNKLIALQADNILLFNNSLRETYIEKILADKLKDTTLESSELCTAYLHMKSVKNKLNFSFLKLKHR